MWTLLASEVTRGEVNCLTSEVTAVTLFEIIFMRKDGFCTQLIRPAAVSWLEDDQCIMTRRSL